MNQRLVKVIKNPYKVFNWLAAHHLLNWMDDKTYLKLVYRGHFGKKLNLDNPITFNEKLQWLKLYNRKPEYTIMVDKVKAKEYVANIIGEEHIIPTLGVWDDPDDIDFDKLPNQFVLKCNHNSGIGLCICKDKSKLDIEKVKEGLRKGLKENFYLMGREWPYKNVPRKILAEKYMVDSEYDKKAIGKEDLQELHDYKFFCFNGEPKVLFVSSDRTKKVCFDYYDMSLNHLDLKQGGDNYNGHIALPEHFEEMKSLAEKISANIPHVRTDFYEINNEVYFGELTFFDSSGFAKFEPENWDERLGKLIVLPPPYCGYLIEGDGFMLCIHIAEEKKECVLTDYKFFCFGGEPFMMYVSQDHAEHATTDFFDMDYNLLPIRMRDPNSENPPACPKEFEEMKQYARMLSKNIPHLRVDFYVINHHVYFGELTFYHNAGFSLVKPHEWNVKLGNLIKLKS